MVSNEDITFLSKVENETQLLQCLKKSFARHQNYSYIDDVLVSINPCGGLSSGNDALQYQPHEFSKIADRAVNHLRLHKKNQCIMVTGDSGSGKTEITKNLITYLTKAVKASDVELFTNIQQAGRLLECFGNACTSTSDNASRFIKLTELLYTQNIQLKGAYFHHYLLEKSRVLHHDKGERNFNIFYQFLVGMEAEDLEKYHLQLSVYHRFMGNDFDWISEQDKYKAELNDVKNCFWSFGFSEDTIFRILAAILHVGDLNFAVDKIRQKVEVTNLDTLRKASSLLGVAPEQLELALVTDMTYVKGRVARRMRSASEVVNARDMLATALYSRLFAWIAWKINQYFTEIDEETSPGDRSHVISLLDPFGFERLAVNGMEQLGINTTNEHLMFLFNQYVFAWELADQTAEGILLQKVDFLNNKEMIDFLMERPDGVFSIVEQESKSHKGTDGAVVKKLNSKNRKHPCYSEVLNCPYPAFTINHFAGKVTYTALNLLTHNRNVLGGSIITCLQDSADDLLSRLFMVKLTGTGAISCRDRKIEASTEIPTTLRKADIKKMRGTVRRRTEMIGNIHGFSKTKPSKQDILREGAHLTFTSQLRNSLSDLMQRNLKSDLQFVRCIRPNQQLAPGQFDDDLVTAQLRYSGVMNTVTMRQQGFPVRIAFGVFIER